MGALDGRVAVVTGAGRGIGRAHAAYLASEGARLVVNDVGAAVTGDGTDASHADEVVAEIRDAGGIAVANHADVSDWESARSLIDLAVRTYGDLDVVVNNAGVIRDRPIWDLSEDELDSVLRVNLKGHVAPTRWAARYWKERAARQGPRDAALVHTSSPSVMGYAGQSNYGAAKGGIATFTLVVAEELAPFGVRSNAIVPAARTRMADAFRAWDPERPTPRTLLPTDPTAFDEWSPGNSSPLVAYLASEECPLSGQVLLAGRGMVARMDGWNRAESVRRDREWTVAELAREVPALFGEGTPLVRPVQGSPFD
jgi:NAD(P)-dependent dehydrogenase (short-subunit alcohol dehydrogenase family)